MKKFKKFISVALSAIIFLSASCNYAYATEENKSVYLGGEPFGLKLYTNGVIVIELESYYNGEEYVCPAESGGIKTNDIIKEVNGEEINSNEELREITESCNGENLYITVERDNVELEKTVTPQKNMAGVYLMGVWVRDSCAGIGTITFYDDNGSYFAALGHGICDADTCVLMPLGSGEAVRASISGIDKSSVGDIGSLNGYFSDEVIGSLTDNSEIGIYGTVDGDITADKTEIEISSSSKITTGKASIYTTINGDTPKEYDIEIKSINNRNPDSNENFIIKVTDEELLEKTGGIVQGMSGSPIIQNGKLVGAVTHVFVNSPAEGYGIIAQNMVLDYGK